uniref:Uncharacterized protein n=1 Tax=Arundo donax TaxID=35708 RepID=A0A0A9EVW7_ARUDO
MAGARSPNSGQIWAGCFTTGNVERALGRGQMTMFLDSSRSLFVRSVLA